VHAPTSGKLSHDGLVFARTAQRLQVSSCTTRISSRRALFADFPTRRANVPDVHLRIRPNAAHWRA